MQLVYFVVDDADQGVFHSTTERPAYAKICLETCKWNYINRFEGRREHLLYCDWKPLGSFLPWTRLLRQGMLVGVIDENNHDHINELGRFLIEVEAWKERGGIERRHTASLVKPC